MSQTPIRWGILSTGGITRNFVADLRLLPDAEVLAVGSRTPEAADAYAKEFGIPRAYGSWADLAADPDVDVIYVATPHSAHYAAAMTCLRAGKPVLCEKPLTLDRASSAELFEEARARGLFLMEAMWTRCHPVIRRAQQLVADGAIGEVTSVRSDFTIPGPFPLTHRLRARALGGGALLDLGVYPITIAHLFLGAPDSVTSWAALNEEGVDEQTGLLFGYESGALAALTCGIVGPGAVTASVTGTKGRIDFPESFIHPPALVLHRPHTEPETMPGPTGGLGYHFEAAEVHRRLRAGELESPLVPHAVTLEVMGLLDTIRAQLGVTYPAF